MAEELAAKVKYEESTFTNSRGMKLCASSWLPAEGEPKALLLLLHGYAVDASTYFAYTASRLAANGYAVFAIDYEGHGKSEGTRALLKTMDTVVQDNIDFITPIKEKPEFASKPKFLIGESMGGAVLLLIHRKEPSAWNGAILLAPMCKIKDELKPPALVTTIMKGLAHVFPSAAILPVKDVIDEANRDPAKRAKIRANPATYQAKPRLGTALTLLNTSLDLESRLDEVTLPFLLLHGEADTVTDPAISKDLHEKAKSTDKTFKLYPGFWHCLTEGELDENVEMVFKDIFEWIDARS